MVPVDVVEHWGYLCRHHEKTHFKKKCLALRSLQGKKGWKRSCKEQKLEEKRLTKRSTQMIFHLLIAEAARATLKLPRASFYSEISILLRPSLLPIIIAKEKDHYKPSSPPLPPILKSTLKTLWCRAREIWHYVGDQFWPDLIYSYKMVCERSGDIL